MLYTEKEKHEIERVKEVFAEHLRQSPDFELLWSDKVGYVWLAIGVNPLYVDIQLFQSTHIFNRETGAMSQLAESSTKQWRLADTFVCGRGVPIGNFVRPYLHFKGKEQGRIDLTLTL